MTQLVVDQCEFTYEAAFVSLAFALLDAPGKLCDLLLDALSTFGCNAADLVLDEGQPDEQGVTCEIDDLEMRVALRGDRLELYCANLGSGTLAAVANVLERIWSGLAALAVGPKTHSFIFDADTNIRGHPTRNC